MATDQEIAAKNAAADAQNPGGATPDPALTAAQAPPGVALANGQMPGSPQTGVTAPLPTTPGTSAQSGTMAPAEGNTINTPQNIAIAQSTGPAPQTQATASSQIQPTITAASNQVAQDTQNASIDNTLNNDPTFQQFMSDVNLRSGMVAQQGSLVDMYTQMTQNAGIPALNTQLLNMKNIIDGTEEDIVKEVQSAGGFATRSQILALSSARNKQLILNYNNLLDTKQMAMENINTMMGLAKEDRAQALQNINDKLQIDQQVMAIKDKMVSAAKEGYNNILNKYGPAGLIATLHSDPNAIALAEKTLGLAPGGLQGLVQLEQNQTNLKAIQDAGITTPYAQRGQEIQDTQTGQGYTSEADFQAKTGMSLENAMKKGLVTSAEEVQNKQATQKQVLNLMDKYGDSGILPTDSLDTAVSKMRNSAIYRRETYIAPSSGGGGGGGGVGSSTAPALSPKDLAIRSIIASNPGEWGKAADAIDAKYGKGTATQYDGLLKSVYQDGNDINALAPLNDIQSIAAAIINGSQPPVLTGLYSKSAAVKAELSRQGFDLAKANQQWTATQKFLSSANSSTQLRMRQAESSVENSLSNLQKVSDEMNRTGFKFANKAELAAAANGTMGQEKAKQAQALLGQVALITDELGQTFMGGNSPTDAAFGLAAKVLQSDFSKGTMDSQIKLIQDNLQYRKTSWSQTGVAGLGSDNAYNPAGQSGSSDTGGYDSYLKAIGQ